MQLGDERYLKNYMKQIKISKLSSSGITTAYSTNTYSIDKHVPSTHNLISHGIN